MSDQVLVACIAAGAAIAASVGAQLIAGALSHGSERRRVASEDHRHKQDRSDRATERLFDSKRIAFSRYLQTRNEYRRICRRLYIEEHPAPRVESLTERARIAGSNLEALEEEIGLLDPSVFKTISDAKRDLPPIRSLQKSLVGYEDWMRRDEAATTRVRATMRRSLSVLGGDDHETDRDSNTQQSSPSN